MSDEFLTVPQAAKQLGKSKMTLYRWIDQDKVQTVKLGGILFIRREEVERLKNAEKVAATAPDYKSGADFPSVK